MSIYDTLNDMQKMAVYHTEGPLLLLAGAGSGKTRVLTHRIAYLIDEIGVNPYNILAITFTNKAAKEMRERVDNIVGYGSESVWVSTFHSTCVRILRRHIELLGYDNNFTIYDTDDQKTLMKEVCKKLEIDTKQLKEKAILGAISSAKDELTTPEQFMLQSQGDYRRTKIAEAYMEYQSMLRSNNALDFDDLIVKAVELFQNNPEVLNNYQERFKYIMVDEYQDTNTAQFKLISTLASRYQNLCVVGDDDQSIYKFRGANIGNILNFEQVFENARVIKLEQNYRSTKNILDAANEVIRNNKGRKDKTLWTDNEVGDLVRFIQLESGYEEANYVAHSIKEAVQKEGIHDYSDVACLYRTNAQSRVLEERLLFLNIPYKIVGGVNFYQRKEIKDILGYLKTIDNGKDDIAVKRIINVPRRGIGLTTINKIQEYAYSYDISFYQALKSSMEAGAGRATDKINKFIDFINGLKVKVEFDGLTELVKDLLNETGYVAELKAENTEEADARIENIDELISKVADYEQNCEEEPTLSGFLEEVALIANIDSLQEDDSYVTLMTVHSAKGLEFPKVYICGMEDGLFPSYMTITSDDKDDMEEERRLCYVAITRAMDELTISCAKQRMIRGEMQYNNISRFVREIPLDLMDTSGFGNAIEKKSPIVDKAKMNPFVTSKPSQLSGINPFRTGADIFEKKSDSIDSLAYKVGDTVRHVKFGEGVVAKIVEGGRDYEVTVDFVNSGTKKMFASFAKLKKV